MASETALLCFHLTQPGQCCAREGARSPVGRACLSPLSHSRAHWYASAGQAATYAWMGASSGLWAQQLCSNREACNPEGLVRGARDAGERDLLSREQCLTAGSLQGCSGAPILLANQPGMGLIPGLCWVMPSLVHLLLCLMSSSPLRDAVKGIFWFSVCTIVYCLKPPSSGGLCWEGCASL